MKLLVLVLVVAVSPAPEGYNLPTPSSPAFEIESCGEGQVKNVDGRCVTPQVTSRIYVYDVPPNVVSVESTTYIHEPKVERNVIFLRLPDEVQGPEPIVIPPPSQQYMLYVLNKQIEQKQRVVEVPSPPASNPEVFFVNYAEGENPSLPIGVDLQTALSSASQGNGQVVESASTGHIDGGSNDNIFGDNTGSLHGGSSDASFGAKNGDKPSALYSTPSK